MKGDSAELILADELTVGMRPYNELTAQEYAAIHLLQPNSGLDWLDDMIRARMRDEMAGRVLQGMYANEVWDRITEDKTAEAAYNMADTMLKERNNA